MSNGLNEILADANMFAEPRVFEGKVNGWPQNDGLVQHSKTLHRARNFTQCEMP